MRKFFLSRTGREQGLMLAFAILAAGAWLMGGVARARALAQDWGQVRAEREAQQLWLEHEAGITTRAAAAAELLDPKKTLNGPRLVAELNVLATEAGLTAEVTGLRTEPAGDFTFHSVQVNFRRVEMPVLIRFYRACVERSPYLGFERLSLSTDRGAPGTLNATFQVIAAELSVDRGD